MQYFLKYTECSDGYCKGSYICSQGIPREIRARNVQREFSVNT